METSLYVGTIRHRRVSPRAHAFTYSIFMPLLDIDALGEAMAVSRLTSYNGRNVAAFDDRDHFGDPAEPLRTRVERSARAHGVALPPGRIFLLTHLRYAGYVFNPISLFYCADPAGDVRAVLAEVNNTYGGRHLYWLERERSAGPFRARVSKAMYVSPFMPFDVDYAFSLSDPGRSLVAHMDVRRPGEGHLFDATLALERRPWTAGEIRAALARFPLMTAKVTASIHWEALKLRLKGLPVQPFPQPEAGTKDASYDTAR
jgi:DUF1365 family protein